jgi:hypothetical protein
MIMRYGERYLVVAYPLTPPLRQAFVLTDADVIVYRTGACSAHPPTGHTADSILGDAPGYLPE